MKGLLLGVFYAFRGFFITLGCAFGIPFAQETLWRNKRGLFDCGFYYFLSITFLAIIVLLVFFMAARWYQYRVRDNPPYSHQYVEDYYSRYTSLPNVPLLEDEENCHRSYGTNA